MPLVAVYNDCVFLLIGTFWLLEYEYDSGIQVELISQGILITTVFGFTIHSKWIKLLISNMYLLDKI